MSSSSRFCQYCNDPLSEDSRWNRKYHDKCSILAHRFQQNESNKRRQNFRRNSVIIHKRDLKFGLRDDYVAMKLAGQIYIPSR